MLVMMLMAASATTIIIVTTLIMVLVMVIVTAAAFIILMMMPMVIVTTATLVIVIKWKLMLQFIQLFISMQFVVFARSFCVFHSYAPMFSTTIISQFRQLSTKYEKNFTFLFWA